jgi:hypothetical protein
MKKLSSQTKYQIFFLILTGAYFLFNGFIPRERGEVAPRSPKVIIWNDDEESIPMDGSKVVIEFTQNDTIYIGSVEANQKN